VLIFMGMRGFVKHLRWSGEGKFAKPDQVEIAAIAGNGCGDRGTAGKPSPNKGAK
jgi:hypothetical protein